MKRIICHTKYCRFVMHQCLMEIVSTGEFLGRLETVAGDDCRLVTAGDGYRLLVSSDDILCLTNIHNVVQFCRLRLLTSDDFC